MAPLVIEVLSGANLRLPNWGRCLWQDSIDGQVFLACASGDTSLIFITSSDSGNTWTIPQTIATVDSFSTHSNFDTFMDPRGNVHCAFRSGGSNTYKFLNKVPASGWSENGSSFAYQTAGDSGVVKGFQGSISIAEESKFGAGGIPGPHPQVIIASKGQESIPGSGNDVVLVYRVSPPFSTGPILWQTPVPNEMGRDGGYPQIINNYVLDHPGLTFYNSITKSIDNYLTFFSMSVDSKILPQNGISPYSETMAIGSGAVYHNSAIAFVCSNSGQDFYSSINSKIPFDPVSGGDREFVHMTSNVIGSFGLPWRNTFINNASGTQVNAGTNCDFTFGDDKDKFFMYVQDKRPDGALALTRFVAEYKEDIIISQTGYFQWPPIAEVTYPSSPNKLTSGGENCLATWLSMKALKHPTEPGVGLDKSELLVTSSMTPNGGGNTSIVIHDVGNSVELTSALPHPNFLQNLTDTDYFFGPTSIANITNVSNIFGSNPLTSGVISPGDAHITMQFIEPVLISEIDIWKQASSLGTVTVSGSEDGVTFTRLGTIVDSTTTLNTAHITSRAPLTVPDPFRLMTLPTSAICEYLRIDFIGVPSGTTINNINILGPGGTKQLNRNPLSNAQVYNERPYIPIDNSNTEKFHHAQDTIPPGWVNTGSVPWLIDASGKFVTPTDLPSSGNSLPQGIVDSGVFGGSTHGNNQDGFALVNAQVLQVGQTATAEIQVFLQPDETNIFGIPFRLITFDYRTDMDVNDTFTIQYQQAGNFPVNVFNIAGSVGPTSYFTQPMAVNVAGSGTIRFIYTKGTATSGTTRTNRVWIDSIVGLNGSPQPSIRGYLRGANAFSFSSIHGFVNIQNPDGAIHGFASGAPLNGSIHGIAFGDTFPDSISSIHGYVLGNNVSSIHGFTFGGPSGLTLTTFPTGSIHGIIPGASGSFSSIHGFVKPLEESSIHGYLRGFALIGESGAPADTGNLRIHGFVLANFPNSSIHGVVNAFGDQFETESLNGYVKGFIGDQFIHGFINRSDSVGTIHGFAMARDPGQTIHGFIPFAPLESQVHGYVLSNKPGSAIHGFVFNSGSIESIFGYTKGLDGQQLIHGYVKRPSGVLTSVHGYAMSAETPSGLIHGFVTSKSDVDESIHAFVSGIEFESETINGYLVGISGSIPSSIHGFTLGAEPTSSSIYGFLIGLNASGVDTCDSHSFPLPAVNSGIIPSGFICNVLA